MKRIPLVFAVIMFLFCSQVLFAAESADITLNEAIRRISTVFSDVDKNLRETANRIGKGLGAQTDMRADIKNLCASRPYAIDCSFLNAKGVIELMEPEKYRKYEGMNLASQAATAGMLKNQKPLFSELFVGIEELQAALFMYPVFTTKKEFAGSVGIFFSPELLVKHALDGLRLRKGMVIMVLQGDGTNVYSSDPAQLRRSVLKSAEYQAFPELKGLVGSIVAQAEGTGTYRYVRPGTQKVVRKNAAWKTVSLYDGFWRVVVTEPERP